MSMLNLQLMAEMVIYDNKLLLIVRKTYLTSDQKKYLNLLVAELNISNEVLEMSVQKQIQIGHV